MVKDLQQAPGPRLGHILSSFIIKSQRPNEQTAVNFVRGSKIQPSSGGSNRGRSLSISELGRALELFQFLAEGQESA